jgi:hypothetical protein
MLQIICHTFTDYKVVTKSWNPTVNAPERVEVTMKTTQTPSIVKRGSVAESPLMSPRGVNR